MKQIYGFDPCDGCLERGNVLASIALLGIGAVLGMVLITLLKMWDRPAIPTAAAINSINCQFCHTPVLKSYKAYRAYHQKPEALLAELVRP
jgi:hypothetical protein